MNKFYLECTPYLSDMLDKIISIIIGISHEYTNKDV